MPRSRRSTIRIRTASRSMRPHPRRAPMAATTSRSSRRAPSPRRRWRRRPVLAEIYAPDLVASEEEYLIASRMGGAIGAASDQRLRALDIPEDEIARLRKTGRSARRIAVVAPANGVVIDKPVQEGMRVDAGEAPYKTGDLSAIWLIPQVQGQDLAAIQPG